MKQRQPMGGFFLLILALTMLVVMWIRSPNNPLTAPAMTEQDVYVALENGTITKARIRPDAKNSTGQLYELWLKSGDLEEVHVLNVSDFAEEFRDEGIPYEVEEIPKENYALTIILPILLSAGLLAAFFMLMNLRNAGGGNAKMMNFGRSRARMSRDSKVNFTNVAGLNEEKEELEEIVDFLKGVLRSIREWEPESLRELFWWVLPEQEKPCLPRRWPGKPKSPFSPFPDRTL